MQNTTAIQFILQICLNVVLFVRFFKKKNLGGNHIRKHKKNLQQIKPLIFFNLNIDLSKLDSTQVYRKMWLKGIARQIG